MSEKRVEYLLKCFRETGNVKYLHRAKKMLRAEKKEKGEYGSRTAGRWQVPCET